jgi:cobalt-zinc-cadmium efflux system membrane fusion protein
LARVRRLIPTVLVLCALGGLALWGHETGWTIPKFSSLTGSAGQDQDDWCAEHAVPESICVECNTTLSSKPATFGWCEKHGVFDCPLEHPEVAQLKVTPRITGADLERAQRALDFADRPQNDRRCKLHPRRIQFASAAAMTKTGIDVAPVRIKMAWEGPFEETVTANGEIGYDQTRIASLSSPLPGKIWRVEKQLGQAVRKGEVLALVEATEVGRAKAEFLQALTQVEFNANLLESLRSLFSKGALSEARVRQVEKDERVSQIRLLGAQQALINLGLPIRAEDIKGLAPEEISRRVQFLGLPIEIARTLDSGTTTANLIPIKAPLDGEVVSRNAVAGEVVDPTKLLFVVADPRQMLLKLNVRLEEAKALRQGARVRFRPHGSESDVLGTIDWISTAVDPKTRTVEVRASLENPKGQLRSNTFGAGRIVLRQEHNAIVVPSEAIHWDGGCHVVFVQDKNFHEPGAFKVFHVRSVRLGASEGKQTEIIAGVLPGEVVVTQGSAILRAELLKANLGAD